MTIIEKETMDAVKSAAHKYINSKNVIDWEQRRYEIAKDLLVATQMGGGSFFYSQSFVKHAVEAADGLIAELKATK